MEGLASVLKDRADRVMEHVNIPGLGGGGDEPLSVGKLFNKGLNFVANAAIDKAVKEAGPGGPPDPRITSRPAADPFSGAAPGAEKKKMNRADILADVGSAKKSWGAPDDNPARDRVEKARAKKGRGKRAPKESGTEGEGGSPSSEATAAVQQ